MFKKDSQLRSPIDVNQIIQEVFALVRDDLQSQRIQIQTELSKKIPKVSGVHIQLQQVIFNLFTNAIEAMASTRGRAHVLRVTSEHREPSDVLITVEDSGSGINPENMDHIFDPFFTTKSHGMGMGLSICRSIVEAHQGRLLMSPAANGGTMFKITLPADERIS
jgi:C4-dicarboxylate-specific signal transduction histidine kinase